MFVCLTLALNSSRLFAKRQRCSHGNYPLDKPTTHTIFEALVRGLQQDAMRRIHGLGFLWRNAEKRCIEHLEVLLQEVRMSIVKGSQHNQRAR
jgi:hypothetical protein